MIYPVLFVFYFLNSSLTSIKAKPKRFSPFQSKGFSALVSVSSIPIPQILSYGLASTRILSPVDKRKSLHFVF